MDINKIILLAAVTLFIYFFFIEIFTMLFRITGMTRNKSRFQVITLFTNSGYTTQEAELIMSHHLRRKLANTTMLFGYILNVTVISVLVNIIMTLGNSQSQDVWKFVIFIGSAFILVTVISKVKFIDRLLQSFIKKIAVKFIYGKKKNVIEVLDNYDQNSIAEVHIDYLPVLCDHIPLKDNGIKSIYGIQVLAIKRKHKVNTEVSGEDFIEKGDLVVLFGRIQNI
jgi:hypothetical protein